MTAKYLFFSKYFLDFLVGLCEFVLAELDQFLCALELFRHLVNVEFVILHLAHDGLQFGKGRFVFLFLFHVAYVFLRIIRMLLSR